MVYLFHPSVNSFEIPSCLMGETLSFLSDLLSKYYLHSPWISSTTYSYSADYKVHTVHQIVFTTFTIWCSYTNRNLRHLLGVWMLTEGLWLSFGHSTKVWFLSLSKLHPLLDVWMLTQGCCPLGTQPRFWPFYPHKNFVTYLMSGC